MKSVDPVTRRTRNLIGLFLLVALLMTYVFWAVLGH